MSDASVQEVSVDELEQALASGARLIDVREPVEYTEVRVPGAVLIPLGEVPLRIEEFRGEGPAYVICRMGGRSRRACELAVANGIEAINVAGGTLAWQTSGRPTESGDSPPPA